MNKSDNNRTSQNSRILRWSFGIVLGLSIGLPLLLSSPGRSRELSRQAVCAANLNGIGKAIAIYRFHHNDLPPPNLAALVADGIVSKKMLVCPSSGMRPAATTQPADIEAHCDYIYAPLPWEAEGWAELPMVFELPSNHGGDHVNVLFSNGHVKCGIKDMNIFLASLQKLNDHLAELRRPKP